MADDTNGIENEDEKTDIVVLEDAEGNEAEFAVLGIVELEDEGTFALLSPTWQLDAPEDDPLEIYVFRYDYDEADRSEAFLPLEDEELVARVGELAQRMMEEQEEGDN